MRSVILAMMTTLDGRLDDPMAWLDGVSDDQYRDIDGAYEGYDAILVGRTTYEEMAAYWPGALSGGTGTNRSMARKMGACRKLVVSRTGDHALTPWSNVEQVAAPTQEALAATIAGLKAKPGGDVCLAGGASLAGSVIGLGLVDEFRLSVYPIVSPGTSWLASLPAQSRLRLLGARSYDNGVVGLRYAPAAPIQAVHRESFTDMLT